MALSQAAPRKKHIRSNVFFAHGCLILSEQPCLPLPDITAFLNQKAAYYRFLMGEEVLFHFLRYYLVNENSLISIFFTL